MCPEKVCDSSYFFAAVCKFIKIDKNPTQQYQKIVKQTLKQCNIIKKKTNGSMNMNPTAPNLHATIKLQKHNTPIRPTINWKNAPANELAKRMIENITQLPAITTHI
jgi:hypothetical protein